MKQGNGYRVRPRYTFIQVLAVIVFFPPYWLLIELGPTIWLLIGRVFGPRRLTVPVNRTLRVVQTARALCGLGLSTAVFWYFAGKTGAFQYLGGLSDKMYLTAGVALAVVPVAVTALIIATRRGFRRELVRRLRSPGSTLLGVLVLYSPLIPFMLFMPDRQAPWPVVLLFIGYILVLVVGLPRIVFLLGKNLFNTADVHPMLPALITIPLAWGLAWLDIVQGSSLPDAAELVLNGSGAVTITVLSLVELRYLRRQGVSVRGGPYPRPVPGRTGRPAVVTGSR